MPSKITPLAHLLIFTIILASLCLSGCQASQQSAQHQITYADVQQTIVTGRTTKAEVEAKFGPAHQVNINRGMETWSYNWGTDGKPSLAQTAGREIAQRATSEAAYRAGAAVGASVPMVGGLVSSLISSAGSAATDAATGQGNAARRSSLTVEFDKAGKVKDFSFNQF